jgi:hypothetical protein
MINQLIRKTDASMLIPLSSPDHTSYPDGRAFGVVSSQTMAVPMVDFSNIAPLHLIDNSAVGSDVNTADNSVTSYMSRLMSSTALSLNICHGIRAHVMGM